MILRRSETPDREPDKCPALGRDPHLGAHFFPSLGRGSKAGDINSIQDHLAFSPWNRFELREAIGGGLAYGDGAAAEKVCEPVGHHAAPPALIDVVHRGEYDKFRTEETAQASEDVHVK